MELTIQPRSSNFAQFDDALWLEALYDGLTLRFDVAQDELLNFAHHLIDVADTCLRKYKGDTDDLRQQLGDIKETIYNLNKQ